MVSPQNNNNSFLNKLEAIIQENLANDQFGVSELAEKLNMSRSNLHRKVKSMADKSVSQFIREVRLAKAMELLKQKDGNVSEIAYKVGFNSVTYFSKCFHDLFDVTPGDVLSNNWDSQENAESKENLFQINRTAFHFLIVISMIAIPVIILLLKGGVFRSEIERLVEEEIVKVILIPEFKDETRGSEDNKLKLLRLELHNKLDKVSNLAVKGKEIAEHESIKSMNLLEMADLLKADYILSGTRLESDGEQYYYFQLLESKTGKTLWQNRFPGNSKEPIIYAVDLAHYITNSIDIELTSFEENQLNKKYAIHPKANQFREDGIALYENAGTSTEIVKKAIDLFEKALAIDSLLYDVYTRLGIIYKERLPPEERDLERAKQYLLKAIEIDRSGQWGWKLLGKCYEEEGNQAMADSCYFKGELYGARDKYYYASKSHDYFLLKKPYESLRDAFMSYKLNVGPDKIELPGIVGDTWVQLAMMEFPEVAKKYLRPMMMTWGSDTTNTVLYHRYLSRMYGMSGQKEKAIEYALKVLENDKTYWHKNVKNIIALLREIITHELDLGNTEKSYYYVGLIDSIRKANNMDFNPYHGDLTYGFSCLEAGEKEKAMFILNKEINTCIKEIKNNELFAQWYGSHMNLAAIYAYLGDVENLLKYLIEIRDSETNIGYHRMVLRLPVFERISSKDRKVRKVIREINKRFEMEHRKIEVLLENYDFLES